MDDGRKLIFISWNIFQFEIILPMECHHFPRCTIHCHWRRGMRQLSLVDIAIFIQTNLWRYLCDCDPLGAFSRQRWARISNERGMSPAVKLNIPTPDQRIYSAGLRSEMMVAISISPAQMLLLIREWPMLQLPRALQTADYQGQHCKWANTE